MATVPASFTEVTLSMRKIDGPSPERDQLIAGFDGARTVDAVRVQAPTAGDDGQEIKRGTLLVLASNVGAGTSGEDTITSDVTCYIPATAADIVAGKSFAIAADSVTLKSNEFAMLACYFGGDFNSDRVILPEGVTVDAAKLVLRPAGIFLRDRVLLESKDINFI